MAIKALSVIKTAATLVVTNIANKFKHHEANVLFNQFKALANEVENIADSVVRHEVTAVAAAESGEAVVVTVTQFEGDGTTALAAATTWHAELFDANGLRSVVAAYTITIGGGSGAIAAAVSADVKPSLIFTLGGDGIATLTVTDVAAGTATTLHLVLTPIGVVGKPIRLDVTFAA